MYVFSLEEQKFISNALIRTSFNLKASDFRELKYKRAIQFLYSTHLFSSRTFDIETESIKGTSGITETNLNRLITQLKAINRDGYKNMYEYTPKGAGPGEVALFYLIQDAVLSGTEKGVDVKVAGADYEVKATNVGGAGANKFAYNFFMGRAMDFSPIISELTNLARQHKLSVTESNIGAEVINALKVKDPKKYEEIRSKYAAQTKLQYFSSKNIIFFNHNQNLSTRGSVAAVKVVQASDIDMHTVTQNSIKPKILL